MRLDDHIFEELAISLGAVQADVDELRRRRAARFAVDGHVLIKPYGVVNSVARQVQLVNVSAIGVCVIDRMMMSAGNQFVVYLPRAGGATMDVICTVRQSRLAAGGTFRVGAEFASEMEANTLLVRGVAGMMATKTSPNAVREEAAENTVNLPAQLQVLHEGPNSPKYPADIREASGVAVSLVTGKAVGAGEEIILEFASRGHKLNAWRCTVTHVRMLNSGQFRASVRINGPANTSRGGWVGWLKGIFRP